MRPGRRTVSWGLVAGPLCVVGCTTDAAPPATERPEVYAVEAPALEPCSPVLLDASFRVDTLAQGLDVPWRIAVAPDGRLFITERTGRIVVWSPEARSIRAWARLAVFDGGEAGLLGLALHPDFGENGEVFVVATFPRFTGVRRFVSRLIPSGARATAVNRVLRFRDADGTGVELGQVGDDFPSGVLHAGAELRFGPDRLLYVSQGDGARPSATLLSSDPRGKILRIDVDRSEAASWEVFASGFRNVQGFDWNPDDGRMYAVDHGPTGLPAEEGRTDNDELNVVTRGGDHGWPWASGFENFDGAFAPLWTWTPSAAPGALIFGGAGPLGRDLWVGHLKRQALSRFRIQGGQLACEDWGFLGRFGRIRSIAQGEDGALYLTTANRSGHIEPRPGDDLLLRLSPLDLPEGGS